jgi:simple sugar transport system ATP-binding protein
MARSIEPSHQPPATSHLPSPEPVRALIEMRSISKRFGGVRALIDVNFTIQAGEIHSLVGENGSGKSTLIKILSGVLAPDVGEIIVDQKSHAYLTPAASQRGGVQIIYQDLSLFPNLSVAENIAFQRHVGAPLRLADQAAMSQQAKAVIARLGVSLPLGEVVGNLPIASRQLVAICRALAADARLVVMDEPTASLTHQEVEALLATIHGLKAHDIATVFISHRLDEVMSIAERVTVLRDGRNVGTFPVREVNRKRLTELMTGHQFEPGAKRTHTTGEPPILEIRELTRHGHYTGIDLALHPGEILGITGRLGSGRTELALSLFGMNPPNSGKILIDGKITPLRHNRDAIRQGIAYVSEDRLSLGLVMPQSIADNIVVSVLDRIKGLLGFIDRGKRSATIERWVNDLNIKTKTANRPVRELSGGNQQRVVLAKWLATNPRILILDSPTVGVDVGAKAGIYQIVDNLAARGLAIILITDEVEEALHQSHRILVMRSGSISAVYSPTQVTEAELRDAINA